MSKVQEHKDKVARIGCIVCKRVYEVERPALLHHPRSSQGKGMRASDWLVIPLCHEHHVGKDGVHNAVSWLDRIPPASVLCSNL